MASFLASIDHHCVSFSNIYTNWSTKLTSLPCQNQSTMMGCHEMELEEFEEWNFDKFDVGFEFLLTDHYPAAYMSLGEFSSSIPCCCCC